MCVSNPQQTNKQKAADAETKFTDLTAELDHFRSELEKARQGPQSGPLEPDFSSNAITVLEDRYLVRDDEGQVTETPPELLRRVARTITAPEETWGNFGRGTCTHRSRVLSSHGDQGVSAKFAHANERRQTFGNALACFVLPLGDSIPEIMETARQIALVQRAGGGIGIDLSQLRPQGSIVRSSGGTTEGPLSFLKMLSGVTEAIQQGAFRRGANMGIMRVDHPDILPFIDMKSDPTQLTNYNLSVAITNDFMDSLKATPSKPHVVLNPHTGQKGLVRKANDIAEYDQPVESKDDSHYTIREVWERIVRRAWQSGDPGLVFIDEINGYNPTPHLGPMRATNPCGEQPLMDYEACNLGSINLAAFYRCDSNTLAVERIDWQRLEQTVELAVRFLDNVIDVNRYPTPEIHQATHATRKIGLGCMGFADLLFKMDIPYDSEEALQLVDRLGSFVRDTGWATSERLADTRGTFPAWKGSVWDTLFIGMPMQNAQVTTIAPTGTISIIAGCSSGIEPLFSLAFTRQVLGGKKLVEVNPVFASALRDHISQEKEVQRIIERSRARVNSGCHRVVQADEGRVSHGS